MEKVVSIKNSTDEDIINSKILVLWEENKMLLVFSTANLEDMEYITNWFVDNYEF